MSGHDAAEPIPYLVVNRRDDTLHMRQYYALLACVFTLEELLHLSINIPLQNGEF